MVVPSALQREKFPSPLAKPVIRVSLRMSEYEVILTDFALVAVSILHANRPRCQSSSGYMRYLIFRRGCNGIDDGFFL